jgi:hypothetical protein
MILYRNRLQKGAMVRTNVGDLRFYEACEEDIVIILLC